MVRVEKCVVCSPVVPHQPRRLHEAHATDAVPSDSQVYLHATPPAVRNTSLAPRQLQTHKIQQRTNYRIQTADYVPVVWDGEGRVNVHTNRVPLELFFHVSDGPYTAHVLRKTYQNSPPHDVLGRFHLVQGDRLAPPGAAEVQQVPQCGDGAAPEGLHVQVVHGVVLRPDSLKGDPMRWGGVT